MDHIESTLRLHCKEPTGHIVNILQGTLWKKPQWVAQIHVGHISLQIVKETSGYIQNVPSGHLAGYIVKAITMCLLITLRSKWWAHCECNLNKWLRSHVGHILSHIVKETPGFFHKVPTGHLPGHIVKELSMSPLVASWLHWWVHCERTQHVPAGYMLDKLFTKSQCILNGNPR